MTDVKRDITLEMGNLELTFHLTPQDVTKYFNATTQANKVAPAHNLLMSTIKPEGKDDLKALLENPVTTMTIAGALLEEYSPNLDIIVKKSSATLTA